MTSLLPPYPPRPSEPLSPIAALRTARRNFLAVFDEKCFEYQFFATRILTRRMFVCNSPGTVAQAFIGMHDSFERKSPQMRHSLAPLLGDGLFVSDGEVWKTRRRIIAPIAHASRLSLFAPVMVEAAAETAARWARLPAGAPIDALREMATLTAEIICRAVFGPRLGSEHANAIVAAFSEYQRLVRQLDIAYFLGLPDSFPRFHSPAIRRAARQFHRVLDHIIRQCGDRRADGENSMVRLLLDAGDPETGEALDDTALRNEAAVIFMAGHETTANALAWVWYLLSQAPEVEARVHAELDEVLGGSLPTLADMPRLAYTRAVFDEAIRLYPPVPLLGRQALRAETIRNRRIPAGSLVVVIPWLLHRHRRLWEQPDHFSPERFLRENAGARQRYSYVPFSVAGVPANLAAGRRPADDGASSIVGFAAAVMRAAQPALRRAFVYHVTDDWIFNRQHMLGQRPDFEARLGRFAERVAAAVRHGSVQEILVVGHSTGAIVAIEVVARVLACDPGLRRHGVRLALLTIGSRVPVAGLWREAVRFRAAVARLATEPSVLWVDYQAPQDPFDAFGFDPVRDLDLELGESPRHNPLIRSPRFKSLLAPDIYRRLRWNFFRMHFQFLTAADNPGEYDYLMIACGPVALGDRIADPAAAIARAYGAAGRQRAHRAVAAPVAEAPAGRPEPSS